MKKNKELGLTHFRVPANTQDAGEDVDLCARNTVDENLNQRVNSRKAKLSKVTAFISDRVFKLSIGALIILNPLDKVAVLQPPSSAN